MALSVDGADAITYADWERRAEAAARGLLATGLGRGARVALPFADMDWIEFAVAYLAVLKAGCVAVHVGIHLGPDEYERRVGECQVAATVHSRGEPPPAAVAGWSGAVGELEAMVEGAPDLPDVRPEDDAEIIYSSATTTGRAKGVIATHSNLMHWCSPESLADAESTETRLTVAPMGTGASAVVINNLLTAPTAHALILAPPDPERVAELVAAHRVGTLLIAPWIATQMARDAVHERYDLSSVHTMGTGSSPIPPPVAERLLAAIPGSQMHLSYSGSQMRPAAVVGTFDPDRPFAVGYGVGTTEYMVVGPEGEPVEDGRVGEIYLRCDAPARTYVGDVEIDALEADGWAASGDLGYVGPAGELCFFDRRKDAIRRDGELLSSVELESVLHAVRGVSEAAVVEVPDAAGDGHSAIAAVVVAAGEEALEEVRRIVSDAFPGEPVPPRVVALDALPRDRLGKVLKRVLRERLREPAPAA